MGMICGCLDVIGEINEVLVSDGLSMSVSFQRTQSDFQRFCYHAQDFGAVKRFVVGTIVVEHKFPRYPVQNSRILLQPGCNRLELTPCMFCSFLQAFVRSAK